MRFIILRYLPGATARLQWNLERIVYAIGLYNGAALGLLSPIHRVLWDCDGCGPRAKGLAPVRMLGVVLPDIFPLAFIPQ